MTPLAPDPAEPGVMTTQEPYAVATSCPDMFEFKNVASVDAVKVPVAAALTCVPLLLSSKIVSPEEMEPISESSMTSKGDVLDVPVPCRSRPEYVNVPLVFTIEPVRNRTYNLALSPVASLVTLTPVPSTTAAIPAAAFIAEATELAVIGLVRVMVV
jgi:hypothetical protein